LNPLGSLLPAGAPKLKPVEAGLASFVGVPKLNPPVAFGAEKPVNENVGPVDTGAGSSSFSGDLTGSGDLMLFGSSF